MSAFEQLPQLRLAELLMNAATRLAEPGPARSALVPMGMPVRRGRLHLGRLRRLLDTTGPVAVAVDVSAPGALAANSANEAVGGIPQQVRCHSTRPSIEVVRAELFPEGDDELSPGVAWPEDVLVAANDASESRKQTRDGSHPRVTIDMELGLAESDQRA